MSRAAALLAGAITGSCLVGGVAAQEEPRSEPRLLPGLELRPTIAATIGFDSNPLEEPGGEGSAFVQLDLGLRATLGEETGTQLIVNLQGSVAKYFEDDVGSQRYALAEVEVAHALSEEVRLSAGVFHEHDAREEPETTFTEVWGRAEADLGRVDLDARVSLGEYREKVDRVEIVEEDLEVYDYRVATADVRAEFETEGRISPLLRGRIGAFDYLEQRPGKPDRDALEHSLLAGAEVRFTDSLTAELGLRRTQRDFEEPGFPTYSRLGPDVRVTWDANDRLRLTAAFGHNFSEPDEEDILVYDNTFVELDLEYEASDKLTLNGGLSFTDQKAVGTGLETHIWRAYADARWLLRERLYLIAAARYEQERPQDADIDGYSRVIVRAGLEASF